MARNLAEFSFGNFQPSLAIVGVLKFVGQKRKRIKGVPNWRKNWTRTLQGNQRMTTGKGYDFTGRLHHRKTKYSKTTSQEDKLN